MWPAIIGGIASVAGSVLPSIIGGGGGDSPSDAASRNHHYSRKAAAELPGIEMNARAYGAVSAGKNHGFHPLTMLGMPTNGSTVSMPNTVGHNSGPDLSFLSDIGQDIAGAIGKNKTEEEKALHALQLQKAQKENQLLDVEIHSGQISNANQLSTLLSNAPFPQPNRVPTGGLEQQGGTTRGSSETLKTHEWATDPRTGEKYLIPTEAGERSPYQTTKGSLLELGQDISTTFGHLLNYHRNQSKLRGKRKLSQTHTSH